LFWYVNQANQWLHGHLGEHGLSTQTLLEAKNELIALQENNRAKEGQLVVLQETVRQRDIALQQLVTRFNDTVKDLTAVREENRLIAMSRTENVEQIGK